MNNPGLVCSPIHTGETAPRPTRTSLDFVDASFHHICDLFPSPIIHIGGNTCESSPREADTTLTRAGLTSGDSSLFFGRALRALHFHGRRAAVWDDITRTYPTPLAAASSSRSERVASGATQHVRRGCRGSSFPL